MSEFSKEQNSEFISYKDEQLFESSLKFIFECVQDTQLTNLIVEKIGDFGRASARRILPLLLQEAKKLALELEEKTIEEKSRGSFIEAKELFETYSHVIVILMDKLPIQEEKADFLRSLYEIQTVLEEVRNLLLFNVEESTKEKPVEDKPTLPRPLYSIRRREND